MLLFVNKKIVYMFMFSSSLCGFIANICILTGHISQWSSMVVKFVRVLACIGGIHLICETLFVSTLFMSLIYESLVRTRKYR